MNRIWLSLVVACCCLAPLAASAYTINDSSTDAIGERIFETYGANVSNVYQAPIVIDLFTNYPQAGDAVAGWNTRPADVFLYETYHGQQYQWAIPLVNHDGFTAGTMYAVAGFKVSDDFDPSGGTGFIYNHHVPVSLSAVGQNYGYASFGGGSVQWLPIAGSPDYDIRITEQIYQDDPNGGFRLLWGTATCANDVISNVPEPMTLILLGAGLVGCSACALRRAPR